MSVMEKDKIDGIGIDEQNNTLVFLITGVLINTFSPHVNERPLRPALSTIG